MDVTELLLLVLPSVPVVGYSLLLWWFGDLWKQIPTSDGNRSQPPSTKVTVILAARNEAENIQAILGDVLRQEYPQSLLEVILVDDHSTDGTFEFADQIDDPRLNVLRLSKGAFGKKAALTFAISRATGQLMLLTDADCRVGTKWVQTIVRQYEQTGHRLLVGPVTCLSSSTPLDRFQALDVTGMSGLAGVGISTRLFPLGNGANLAYEKTLFEELNGFATHSMTPSGDDVLFIRDAVKSGAAPASFVKHPEALVSTRPVATLGGLINQRLRWASKSNHYLISSLGLVQILAFLTCASFPLFVLFVPWIGRPAIAAGCLALLLKTVSDFRWLRLTTRVFGQSSHLRGFLLSELIHTLMIGGVGILSVVGVTWSWKARRSGMESLQQER